MEPFHILLVACLIALIGAWGVVEMALEECRRSQWIFLGVLTALLLSVAAILYILTSTG